MKYFYLLLVLTTVNCNPFTTLFSWKLIDHSFIVENTHKLDVKAKNNPQDNVVPYGLNVWGDRLFITVTHVNGISSNLNYINMTEARATNNISPFLRTYPEQKLNYIFFENSIVNIRRFAIDTCHRLWGVDNGDITGDIKIHKPKRLLAIDLNTNKIILSHTFSNDIQRNSYFVNTIVDVNAKNCSDTYVYNADQGTNAIVVYSMAKNSSWRITHSYFHPDIFNGDFNVNGKIYQTAEGIIGMTLGLPKWDNSKTLFFNSLSGIHEFTVSTNILKNISRYNTSQYLRQFHIAGNRGPNTQATSSVFDENTGIIYFTQVNRNAIACWDTQNDLKPETFHIVAEDKEKLVFPNDMVIESKTRKLYVLSNNLPAMLYGKYNPKMTNFRVLVASLDDLATKCRKKSSNWFTRKIKSGAEKIKSIFNLSKNN